MKLRMQPGKVAIVRSTTHENSSAFQFAMPEDAASIGRVVATEGGLEDRIGKKVFFGTERDEVRIQGTELVVMEWSNVFGEIEDEENSKTSSSSETSEG